jgi:hypothetical protein
LDERHDPLDIPHYVTEEENEDRCGTEESDRDDRRQEQTGEVVHLLILEAAWRTVIYDGLDN